MAKISDLSEELLVKILSFLPTKDAVSTSILSKQWKFLWMWCPDFSFDCCNGSVRDFVNKNLPLLKAPIIKSLRLSSMKGSYQADDSKTWVGIAVSRRLLELGTRYYSDSYSYYDEKDTVVLFLPNSLYTCNSLVTLNLEGKMVLVDVPQTVCLPSLKKLHLSNVTYSNEDSLRLLLCCCPAMEDLLINREHYDNVGALAIKIPSLQRLSLCIHLGCPDDECVIVTPSLKYLKVGEGRCDCSYLIETMPDLEEADIFVTVDSYLENILKAISTVKRLSFSVALSSRNEVVHGDSIFFSNLENLKLYICSPNWSKIGFQLLKDSPNLEVLDLERALSGWLEYEPVGWSSNETLVPECLLTSLKTLKFKGSTKEEEERDFLNFIIKHARCLESTSISG